MNKQEIFDFAVAHLRKMERRCMINGSCRYLNPLTGERCVAGAFFPLLKRLPSADQVSMDYSTSNITWLVNNFRSRLPKWFTNNVEMLSILQCIHDNGLNWKDGKFVGNSDLHDLAMNYSLEYKEPAQ